MCCIGERDRIVQWRQEARRLAEGARLGLDLEEPERFPSAGRRGAKAFALERTSVREERWFVFRKYATEVERDQALRQLQNNDRGLYRYRW